MKVDIYWNLNAKPPRSSQSSQENETIMASLLSTSKRVDRTLNSSCSLRGKLGCGRTSGRRFMRSSVGFWSPEDRSMLKVARCTALIKQILILTLTLGKKSSIPRWLRSYGKEAFIIYEKGVDTPGVW